MYSKKIKNLIACINKLELSKAVKADIQGMIKKWSPDAARENEDKIISIIFFFEIIAKYPELINHPKHKAFIQFGATQIDEMPEQEVRQRLPGGRK